MSIAQDIKAAERDYDRALRHPRGEGLDAAGNRLHRLYAQQARTTGDAQAQQPASQPALFDTFGATA